MKHPLAAVLVVLLLDSAHALAADGPELRMGGEVRMRGYDLKNMWTSNSSVGTDDWSVFRLRASLFARVSLERGVAGYLKITNQNFGEGVTAQQADKWEVDNQSSKLFLDNAYIDITRLFDLPFNLRVGRQDVIYGTGFVLFDGQSQFGSTSAYLDGIRAQILPWGGVSLDVLYFKDEERDRANSAHDDITLAGLYLSAPGARHPALPGSGEVYVLNRRDGKNDKDITMVGVRLARGAKSGLDYGLEGAVQRGDFVGGISQEAFGTKCEVGFRFGTLPWAPRVFAGLVWLSGDDPATEGTSERWDAFYGGWPQFGDLLAWKYINLGTANDISRYDPGYASGSTVTAEVVYSNVRIPAIGVSVRPLEKLSVEVSAAPMSVEYTAEDLPKDFGDYYQLFSAYRYSDHLGFALYGALLEPGGAFGPAPDLVHEVFWEFDLDF